MGRAIAVAASNVDEALFLAFVRETADIKIFRSFAPTTDELWVNDFAPFGPNEDRYFLWNTRYAWKPKYRRTEPPTYAYIEAKDHGPVLSFRRTDMKAFLEKDLAVGAFGGLYWGQYNRQKGFLKWYEAIVRWVRQTGENLCPGSASAVYCLPDALRLRQTSAAVRRTSKAQI